jgi:hypothetical protein
MASRNQSELTVELGQYWAKRNNDSGERAIVDEDSQIKTSHNFFLFSSKTGRE